MDMLFDVASSNLEQLAQAFKSSCTIAFGLGIPIIGFIVMCSVIFGILTSLFEFLKKIVIRLIDKQSKCSE